MSLPDDVDKTQLKQFDRVKEDLTVTDEADLILCGNRIVIPTVLQQRAVEIAHEVTKELSRRKRCYGRRFGFQELTEW